MLPRNLLLFLGLLLVCTTVQVWVFNSLESLPGTDAYYYALQLKWLTETGHLKIPDTSPVFYLMAPFAAIGHSGAAGFLIYSMLSLALLKACLMFQVRHRPFVMLWTAVSPSLTFLSYEFPKQFLGMIAAAAACFFIRDRNSLKAFSIFVFAIFYSVYFHLGMLPGAFVLTLFKAPESLRNRFVNCKWSYILGGFVLIVVVSLWLISSGNYQRFNFHLVLPGIISLAFKKDWGVLIVVEIIGLILMTGVKPARAIAFSVFAVLPAFLPFFNETSMSLGERFALMMPFFLVILIAAVRETPGRLPSGQQGLIFMAVLFLCAGSAEIFTMQTFSQAIFRHYEERNADYDFVRAELAGLPKPPLLIAKLGLNYYLKYHLMIETFPYEPEKHWDKTLIWRVVDGVDPSYLYGRLSVECLKDENFKTLKGPDLSILREDCFESFRNAFDRDTDEVVYARLHDQNRNPINNRPEWVYSKYKKGAPTNSDSRFSTLPAEKDGAN